MTMDTTATGRTAPTTVPSFPRSAHLIGIGGAGMRSLARALHARGVMVSGSDAAPAEKLRDLNECGIRAHSGHAESNLEMPDVVVYSTAIPENNPELRRARQLGVTLMHRAEMLAAFLGHHRPILVAGTHGKTTTTTLVALLLEAADMDPWAFVGGEVREFAGNVRCGGLEWAVAEADESDGSFLGLPGEFGIITNIESEHLSYWGTDERLFDGFTRFADRFAQGGLVTCLDDPGVRALGAFAHKAPVTYGSEDSGALVRYRVIEMKGTGSHFEVLGLATGPLRVQLGIPGLHNVANATGAVALAAAVGADVSRAVEVLAGFHGVGRRFTKYPLRNDVLLVDDYAHHATEVHATIEAARLLRDERGGRIIAVFQPHRHSRAHHYRHMYGPAMAGADIAVTTGIYAAGESPIPGFDARTLNALVGSHREGPTHFADSCAEACALAHSLARPGDILLFLGAGSITDAAAELSRREGAAP